MILAATIRSQVLAAGMAGLAILLVIGGVGTYGIRSGTSALAQVFEQRVEPMRRLQDIDRDLKEVRFRMAGVLLDQMPATGSRIHLGGARVAVADNWTAFKAAAGDSGELTGRIDKSMSALPAFFDRLERAYAAEDTKTLGRMLEEEWPAFHAGISKPMESLIPAQQLAVKQTYEASRDAGAWMIGIAAASAGVGMLLMGFVGWLLMREMHGGVSAIKSALAEVAGGNLHARAAIVRHNEFGDMARSLDATTAKLAEVASGIRGLSEKTAGLADNLAARMGEIFERGNSRNTAIMNVSAAIEEISAAGSSIAASAATAETMARRNEQVASAGNDNMAQSLGAAREVVAAIRGSATHVTQLNGSIQEIGKITVVIQEIADQTNLLALNAAIEAARAGEQGCGFAVVADEVRKLAERTTSSTAEISSLIQSIRVEAEQAVATIGEVQRRVEESTGLSQSTGGILGAIVVAAGESSVQIGQIAASVREQSSATEDISRQIAEIAELTELNSHSLHTAAEIAADMAAVSQQLRELARQFR